MKLVIFDLDGTLTQTNEVDDYCFPRTFANHLGVRHFNVDWSAYSHGTDAVVFREAFARHFGRPPTDRQSEEFELHFVDEIAVLYRSSPEMFREVPGATNFITHMQRGSQWAIAIATGCWKRAAEFKCHAARLSLDGVPRAYAEDGPSREAIVTTAINRATECFGCKFERIVSVGDRNWDVKTARNLQLPFLGVGQIPASRALLEAGAHHVIEDYLDPFRVIDLLHQVEIPGEDEYTQR